MVKGVDLDPIQDAALIAAGEAPGLDPGVGKVPLAIMAEEEHAAHGRHRLPLVVAHEPQALQIAASEGAERCERLGSSSLQLGVLLIVGIQVSHSCHPHIHRPRSGCCRCPRSRVVLFL